MLSKLDNSIEAQNYYLKALDVDPNFHSARLNFGILSMKRGNFVEARCHFEKLLLDEPKNISALVNLGESQVRLGDNNSAVETF